jgi:serine/threonine-protein kinase
MRDRRIVFAFVAILGGLAPRLAHGDDRATAQQLFEQGKRLMSTGNAAEACPKLEAAAQLSRTPGVRLNLADCWLMLGRTASAWAMYAEALDLAERQQDAAAAKVARTARVALEPKLSYVKLNVTNEPAVPGLELSRDGEKLPRALWGTRLPVDPGEHEFVAAAPGYKRWSAKVEIKGQGATESVVVPTLERDENAPPAMGPAASDRQPNEVATTPREASTTPFGTQRTLALISGGLGIAGVAVGSVFGLVAMSKRSEYRSHVGADGQCTDMTCQTASHSAYSAGTVSTIAFVAGGVLLATGGVLWLTAPSRSNGTQAYLHPTAAPNAAGLALSGLWR